MAAGTYQARFSRLGQRLEQGVKEKISRASKKALETLVNSTPVDTGTAISNWQVTTGATGGMGNRLSAYSPGQGGSTRSANIAAALSAGYAKIDARGPKQSVSITNPLPYIGRLNAGWSQQAPAGFVDRAIQSAKAGMQGVKIF